MLDRSLQVLISTMLSAALLCGCIKSNVNGVIPSYFIISDLANNRVLVWQYNPINFSPSAQIVLGQPDFISSSANNPSISAQSLNNPISAFFDGTRLFLADLANNRVLIWNKMPTVNQQPADLVLGQPNFYSSLANGGLGFPSAQTFSSPVGIYSNGHQLFIADKANNRILIWNEMPSANGQAADAVLGQSSMNTAASGAGATGLNGPFGLISDGYHLFESETGASRILVWNGLPSATQTPASVVLGWLTMGAKGAVPTPSAYSLFQPRFMCTDGTHLLVGDGADARGLIWNSIPLVNDQPADVVVGKPDFVTTTGTTSQSIFSVTGGACGANKLFLASFAENRVVGYNSYPRVNGQAADFVIGQNDFISTTPNPFGVTGASLSSAWTAVTNEGYPGVWRPGGY